MLFLVGMIIWLFVYVNHPIELVPPALAVIVRAGYLHRTIRLFNPFAIFVVILAIVAQLAFPLIRMILGASGEGSIIDRGVIDTAAVFAGRLYITMLAMQCIRSDPSMNATGQFFSRPFAEVGVLSQLIAQYPDEVLSRMGDIVWIGKKRASRKGSGLRAKTRVIKQVGIGLSIEMTTMMNQVAVILASRGRIPRVSHWKRLPIGYVQVFAADMFMAALLTMLMSAASVYSPWGR